jgi:hypothetical protein
VAPVDTKGQVAGEIPPAGDIVWQPELAPEGPVTILITIEDRRIRIFRAGIEIGHAPFTLGNTNRKITLHVLTKLEPSAEDRVSPASDRPISRWLMISGKQETIVSADELLSVIQVAPEFLRQVGPATAPPGTTMVIAQPASTSSTTTTTDEDFTVITGEK